MHKGFVSKLVNSLILTKPARKPANKPYSQRKKDNVSEVQKNINIMQYKCDFKDCEYVGKFINFKNHVRRIHIGYTSPLIEETKINNKKIKKLKSKKTTKTIESIESIESIENVETHSIGMTDATDVENMENMKTMETHSINEYVGHKVTTLHFCNYINCNYITNNTIDMFKHYEFHNVVWCNNNGINNYVL
jgi:hypothetical protein